jgi:peroxiredoxin
MNPILIFWLISISLAIVVGCWLGWQLLRQNGRLLLRLEELEKRLDELEFGEPEPPGLPAGSAAPQFTLPDLAGQTRTLTEFQGQPFLLIFFNPACGYCRDLAPKLAVLTSGSSPALRDEEAQTEIPGPKSKPDQSLVTSAATNGEQPGSRALLLIVTTGDADVNRKFFDEHQLTCPVLLQKEMEVAAAYKANGTPSGYLISPDGKIASQLAIGGQALLILAEGKSDIQNPKSESDTTASGSGDGRDGRFSNRSLARSKIKRDGLKAGTPAPEFRLPRLDGRGELSLTDLRGRRVLLVFSSPGCGPCNTLAPEFEKFHREHPELEVIMISKGELKENRAKVKEHGLTFPIVVQQQWEISRRYAMFATPIAYLIDEAGVIVHDVAVGLDAILGLLNGKKGQPDADVKTTPESVAIDHG